MRFTVSRIPFVQPVEFIGGLFPRKQVSIIASEPGCGKTWAMLQFCSDISSAYNWGKFYGCSFVEKDRKALLLIGDCGKEMISERIRQMNIEERINDSNVVLYFTEDMVSEKYPFLINTQEGRRGIELLIQTEKPDIIFFDTFISFMTGDENSAKEIGEIFIELRSMAEENNCAIVLNHHFRKTAKGEGKRKSASLSDVIGSSAMARLSSLMIGMTKQPDDGTQRNIVNVFSIKTWYKEMPPFDFEINGSSERVSLIPNYTRGNIRRAINMLTEFSKEVKDGLIVRMDELQQALRVKKEILKPALNHHPAYTPLTDEPECDRFIVHQERND